MRPALRILMGSKRKLAIVRRFYWWDTSQPTAADLRRSGSFRTGLIFGLDIAYCVGCRGVQSFAMGLWIPAFAGMTEGTGMSPLPKQSPRRSGGLPAMPPHLMKNVQKKQEDEGGEARINDQGGWRDSGKMAFRRLWLGGSGAGLGMGWPGRGKWGKMVVCGGEGAEHRGVWRV